MTLNDNQPTNHSLHHKSENFNSRAILDDGRQQQCDDSDVIVQFYVKNVSLYIMVTDGRHERNVNLHGNKINVM